MFCHRSYSHAHLVSTHSSNFFSAARIRQVVWRGSLSENDRYKVLTSVRWRAAKLVFNLKSDLYDFGFTSIPSGTSKLVKIDVAEVGGLKDAIEPMASLQRYFAILDMDGNSWSSRFATLLCYNSVVIKVEPKYLEYFYNDLEPWTHYIPVKDDLSDLHENVVWALDPKNEATVVDIIASANEWCTERMVPEDLAHDLLDIWESYVRLLDRADSNWQKEWMKTKSLILSATSRYDLFRLKEPAHSL
jgi:Glycosyl transferase family 90